MQISQPRQWLLTSSNIFVPEGTVEAANISSVPSERDDL
jgi:hypothetical protein